MDCELSDLVGRLVQAGEVSDGDVLALRRLIFADGGEGPVIVGAREADMFFRIKNAALHASNASGWLQLFVQVVGNHLMAHSNYRPLSREDAIRLNAEMEMGAPSLAGFFRRMIPGEMLGCGTILDAFKQIFPREENVFAKSISPDEGRELSAEEAIWLKMHIASDSHTDQFEKALLTFIIDEIGHAPAMLSDLSRRRA